MTLQFINVNDSKALCESTSSHKMDLAEAKVFLELPWSSLSLWAPMHAVPSVCTRFPALPLLPAFCGSQPSPLLLVGLVLFLD